MKHIIGATFIILVLCALNASLSCSLTGDKDSVADSTGVQAPPVQPEGTSIVINSAPIKDESFLSTISYANIFRQSATDENGTDADDWINIGQVSCTDSTGTLNSFSFIDKHVYTGNYYSYCVRYYNGSYYVYSDASGFVNNASGTGEAEIQEDATFLYYQDDKNSLYAGAITAPDTGISADTSFDSLCIILNNGKTAKPITLVEEIPDTGTVDIDDTGIDMHKKLPADFLDVALTPTGLVLFSSWTDTGATLQYYRWTNPKAVSLLVLHVLENGDVSIGTADSSGGSPTPASQETFLVPSLTSPTNAYDASPLSRSALSAGRSLATGLDITPYSK
ncbi:MAG: hypothetical protein K6G80_11950 [Treponema sp.]|nr:hypothetical protein [Treponema sp.]